ncbi:MAG: hypothetical protein ACPF8V_11660, partial [Luteibaculum sp.]
MEHQSPQSIKIISRYLKNLFPKLKSPGGENQQVLNICIPAYREESLAQTLSSLSQCASISWEVHVWVNLNQPEGEEETEKFHDTQKQELESIAWPFHLHVLQSSLPRKKAGVGLARKITMDKALLQAFQTNALPGFLVCLDGDCTVSNNYLEALQKHISEHPKTNGFSIQFEHPLEALNKNEKEAIVRYECHLRLYRLGLQWAGHPYAFHTVGSSMAISTEAY